MFTFGFMRNQNTVYVPSPQTSYPIGDGTGTWSVIAGSGTDLYKQIDDVTVDDDTTYIGSDKVVTQEDQIIEMQALSAPTLHTLTKINVRYRRRGSSGSTVQLRVLIDGTTYGTKSIENDSDWHDWTILLTTLQSQALNWTNQMDLTLQKLASTYTRGAYVSRVTITTEQ
jgi:hypothetical protein